jgi:predicted nucleic acid-binding protein
VHVETVALVQRRLGLEAVQSLARDLLPLMRTVWVDESIHQAALAALLAEGRRPISLVDHVSFELMRRLGVATAFAFDEDFDSHGFRTVP